MGGTTVWRPHVRQSLPDTHEVEVKVGANEQDGVKQGVKRKQAPRTKGPCEHGVKYRSKCKVCGACPHGRIRSYCKECGGSQICEHDRIRRQCKECGGGAICEHGRRRSQCKECGGSANCDKRKRAPPTKGPCEHGVKYRSQCKVCSACPHGRWRHQSLAGRPAGRPAG